MEEYRKKYGILVQVLEGGKLPTKANHNDAGFDVYATEDIILRPGEVLKHPLNIRLHLPEGAWARIETKSGLGSRGMMVWAGVIDEGYRGIPHVIMSNINMKTKYNRLISTTDNHDGSISSEYVVDLKENVEPIIVYKGAKLAQITMNPHSNRFFMVQVDEVSQDTERGTGGFGSSGS